jgi:hypothetical protein
MVTSVPWQLQSTQSMNLARLDRGFSRAPARGPRSRGGHGHPGGHKGDPPNPPAPTSPAPTADGAGPAAMAGDSGPDEQLAGRP